ncbi:hypothetical protein V3N99_22170 (plasmid) [Dermatophilaceae bacterium Soc4.6]
MLAQQRFELPGLQAAYDATLDNVLLATSRRAWLDKTIFEMAHAADRVGHAVHDPLITRDNDRNPV